MRIAKFYYVLVTIMIAFYLAISNYTFEKLNDWTFLLNLLITEFACLCYISIELSMLTVFLMINYFFMFSCKLTSITYKVTLKRHHLEYVNDWLVWLFEFYILSMTVRTFAIFSLLPLSDTMATKQFVKTSLAF